MAAPRRHPLSKPEASAGQLTLVDWERELARDSEQTKEASPPQPEADARATSRRSPLRSPLASPPNSPPAQPGAVSGDAGTAQLLTLDQLVAELPPAKRPETWKRWLYERTRRGEIPGCVKLGGMLFFQRESAVAWLRAGMTATK